MARPYKTVSKESRDKRRFNILKLICQEYTSDEIGTKLDMTKKTVERIRLELLKETKSRNVVGLVKYAIKNKIYRLK